MSMTARERVVLAATLAVLAGGAAYYGAVRPWRAARDRIVAECMDTKALLDQYRRKIAAREQITAALGNARGRLRQTDNLYQPSGGGGTAAALALQGQLKQLFLDASKLETSTLPERKKERQIGYRVTIECTTAQLAEYLRKIEDERPLLEITGLSINRVMPPAPQPGVKKSTLPIAPVQVKVGISLYGYMPEEGT